MGNAPTVLIADDQEEPLCSLLKAEGYQVATASSPAEVERAVSRRDHDAAILALHGASDTPFGRAGLDLISRLNALDATLPVIVLTRRGDLDSGVEAMRRGARDHVLKPWDEMRLLASVRTQIDLGRALRQSRRLEGQVARAGVAPPEVIAQAPSMAPVLRLVERVGPSDANVLITGEPGTGKEVVARWLHSTSARSGRPFIAVNVGGLAEGSFESELFGHVRGASAEALADRAGCFELAEGGTLFLEEVGNLRPAQQEKLLQVIQIGEFRAVGSSKVRRADVRILSATRMDLGREVAEGRLREDLLRRLNAAEVRLPPLRERKEDLPRLAAHFLRLQAARDGRAVPELPGAALQLLLDQPWPGNVRELEHVLERAVLLARGDRIAPEDLGLRPAKERDARLEEMTLDQVERTLVHRALARAGGKASEAAKALGLSRSAFYRRLQQFGRSSPE